MFAPVYSSITPMTARILAAQPLVEQLKKNLRQRCDVLKSRGVVPSMSVVLVGNNPASLSYIRNKKRMCEEVGANFSLFQLPDSTTESAFFKHLEQLNADPSVHGIIIQLPVSEHLKKLNLSDLVAPHKDIDGFHSQNTKALYMGTTNLNLLLPCTPKGIVHLLHYYKVPISGKHAVVIGRSLIVGKPLTMLLSNLNATVTLAHSKSDDIQNFTRNADIVICAVGKAKFLNHKHFEASRKTTVIDVGMNTVDGKLAGDVDFDEVKTIVEAISPAPGGVGPMTVVTLIENLITATENQLKG